MGHSPGKVNPAILQAVFRLRGPVLETISGRGLVWQQHWSRLSQGLRLNFLSGPMCEVYVLEMFFFFVKMLELTFVKRPRFASWLVTKPRVYLVYFLY